MTVVTMVWVQEHVHEVRNATKAVLSYLAFKAHYDDGTAAWPAIGTIAGACGLSEKTVQRSIDQLLDLGLLEPGQQTFSAINPKTGKPVRRNYQTVVWNVICKESNLPTEPFEDRNASKVRAAMKRADKAKAKMPSPEPEGGEDDGREDKMSGFSDERQPEETKAKMSPLENVENKPVSSNLPKMSPLERQGGEGDGSEDKMSKNLDKMSPNNTLKYNYPSLPTGELPASASGKRPGMEDGNNTTTGGDSDAATVMDHLASVRSKLSLTTTEPTKRDLSKIGNLVSRVVKAHDARWRLSSRSSTGCPRTRSGSAVSIPRAASPTTGTRSPTTGPSPRSNANANGTPKPMSVTVGPWPSRPRCRNVIRNVTCIRWSASMS